MLTFFRKYQKIVFGFITAMLIISIAFFGSYSAFTDKPLKEKDFVLGNAINGSDMTHLQIEHLVRFLSTDQLDSEAMVKGITPNFFNDGVIRKDFIETGLAHLIVERYFDELKKDFEERLVKQKKFNMYTHPQAPFIAVENVYNQFMPTLVKNIQEIKKDTFVLTKENFSKLAEIYSDQSHFPSYLLRRFLGYQEKQYNFVKQDPYLYQGDLSLFYFHTIEDWFGPTFLQLVSQVIHNASLYAQEKGYKVSLEEAKTELLKTGYEALKSQKKDQKVTSKEVMEAFKHQLASIRLTEKQALEAWKKVLLFRKLFEDRGDKVLVDRLCYDKFHRFSSEGVDVDVYKLPVALRFQDLRSLFKMQTYLEAVNVDKESAKDLIPKMEAKPMEDIAKVAPLLAEKVYEVEFSQVSKKDLMSTITLKETWDWETKEENWSLLKSKFSELGKDKLISQEAKLECLDRLEDSKRYEIDEFARSEIAKTRTHVLGELLSNESLKATTFKISLAHHKAPLEGITNSSAFMSLLDKAALKGQLEATADELEARNILENYTQDGEHYFRIYVITKSKEPQILTFEEANRKGVLDELLDDKLKKYHAAAKNEKPAIFYNEDGSSKDFLAVRDEIGKYLYADLLKDIEKSAQEALKKQKIALPQVSSDFYATYRFYELLKKEKNRIQCQKEGYCSDADLGFLHKQFKLVKDHETVRRSSLPLWADESMFSMPADLFSDIKPAQGLSIYFYQVKNKIALDEKQIEQHVLDGHKLLGEDAKRYTMAQFLGLLASKDAIHLDKNILPESP